MLVMEGDTIPTDVPLPRHATRAWIYLLFCVSLGESGEITECETIWRHPGEEPWDGTNPQCQLPL